MPNENGFILSDFRRMGIALTWPEAVALVLEATDQVQRTGDTGVTPDLDHVRISSDGSVTILPGSPIPAHPVRQAAGLLTDLLDDAPAPSELRSLIAANQRNPPACVWIEEFTTALAYYERPHRAQIIAALADRASSQSGATNRVASTTSSAPSKAMPAPITGARSESRSVFARWWSRWFGKTSH